MIPIEITLHNFLSYQGTHHLDLTNSRSIIITGNNGAGKSSIIDAMLFTLFGFSRNSQDHAEASLVHFGEMDSFTECIFQHQNTIWRVKRNISPSPSIEIKEKRKSYWKIITKPTDEENQNFIHSIVNISLKNLLMTTVMSSSFSTHKEFLENTPKERFQRLSHFLRLDVYQESFRKTQIDFTQNKIRETLLEDFIQKNKDKLIQKKVLQKRIEEESTQRDVLEEHLNNSREAILALHKEIHTINNLLERKSNLMDQIHQLRNYQNERHKERSTLLETINELQQSIQLQHEIENGYKQLLDLIQRNKVFNENLEQRQRLEVQMKEIQNNIEQEEMDLKTKRNELEQKEIEYSEKKSLLPDLNLKMHEIQSKLKEMEKKRYQIENLEEEKRDIQDQIASLNEKIGSLKQEKLNFLETCNTIAKQIAEYEQVIQKETSTKKKLQTIHENTEKVKLLQNNIEIEQNKKQNLLTQNEKFHEMAIRLREKIHFLELPKSTENRCPLCGTPLNKDKEADILLNYRRDLEMRETTLEKNKNTIQRITNKIETLKSEIFVLSSDFDQEKELQSFYLRIQDYKSNLGRITENHYRAKLQESKIEEELNKTLYKITNLKSRYKTIDKQYVEAMYAVSNQSIHENTLSDLQLQISSALEADQKLPLITKQLIDIKRRLETKNYATDQWKKINDVKKKFFAIHYSSPEHETIKNKINQLKYFETEKRIMDEKLDEKNRILNQLNDVEQKLEKLEIELKEQIEKIKSIPYQKHDLEEAEEHLKQLEESMEKYQDEKEIIVSSIAKHERDMEVMYEVQKEYDKSLKELTELRKQTEIVTFCQQIFSQENLPAYILYRILPLIERDVNRILRNISKDSLSIQIHLDVKSDVEKGIQVSIFNFGNPVEFSFLSQGEKFSLHIAFRLALSYILHKNQSLKTDFLCIDQDLGSLDASSKNQIMYTILKIQNQFQKMIFITHQEDFKNSFHQHLFVEKKKNSSYFSFL
jgi:exonuclease SbcC